MYRVEHGKFNRMGYAYSGSSNMNSSNYMKPNSSIHFYKGAATQKKYILARPVSNSGYAPVTLSTTGSGGAVVSSSADVTKLIGMEIGTLGGLPVIMGVPMSYADAKGVPTAPMKITLNNNATQALVGSSNALSSMPNQPVVMFAPIVVFIICWLIVMGIPMLLAFAVGWLASSGQAKDAEINKLKNDAMQNANQTAAITKTTTVGDWVYTTYEDGTVMGRNTVTGETKTVQSGGVPPDPSVTPPPSGGNGDGGGGGGGGTGVDWGNVAKWSVIGIVGLSIAYVVLTNLPKIKSKTRQIVTQIKKEE